MPTYVYETVLPDGEGGEQFEVLQSMAEPALTVHPETGQPVRRVLSAPNISGKWSDHASSKRLGNDKRLGELGFTKYVKAGGGYYEKRAGQGPDVISKDG